MAHLLCGDFSCGSGPSPPRVAAAAFPTASGFSCGKNSVLHDGRGRVNVLEDEDNVLVLEGHRQLFFHDREALIEHDVHQILFSCFSAGLTSRYAVVFS